MISDQGSDNLRSPCGSFRAFPDKTRRGAIIAVTGAEAAPEVRVVPGTAREIFQTIEGLRDSPFLARSLKKGNHLNSRRKNR
jgi:hypothetical protein